MPACVRCETREVDAWTREVEAARNPDYRRGMKRIVVALLVLTGCRPEPNYPTGVQPWSGPPGLTRGADQTPSPAAPLAVPDAAVAEPVQPAYSPPPYVPPAVPIVADATEQQRWWCYSDAAWGQCSETKADCETELAGWADFKQCDYEPRLSRKDCEDAITRARGVKACARQDRAACFTRKNILQDFTAPFCSPTIALCKRTREYTLKNMKDDIRVLSDCRAE
jgi:hypothetical protein